MPVEGLGFGESARAALITRGLAEITRLGLKLGARSETLMGLSGVGDLPVWATGPAILLAITGTSLAPFVIERMTDHGFRQWTRAIIFAISVVYLARGGWLLWHG